VLTFDDKSVRTPQFTGSRIETEDKVEDLIPFIDWTFFFAAWEMKMKFPKILKDEKLGSAARELYGAGREMLDRIVDEGWIEPRAIWGFWPAHADGDDLVLFTDATKASEAGRFPMLRQQAPIADSRPNRSLADFVAPKDSGVLDHVGAFCVTTGHEIDERAKAFEKDHDDYSSILLKALADRLAEAYAEYLHARARKHWGDRSIYSNQELIAERYRGIRPAFGYPACPDHLPKEALFRMLDCDRISVELTESMAMWPAASVSGLYFGHSEAKYFNVARIGRDQAEDYARRLGRTFEQVEPWLRPVLG